MFLFEYNVSPHIFRFKQKNGKVIQSRVDKIEDVCTNFQQTNDSLSEKKFLELFTTVVRIRRAVSRLKITN